MNDLKYTVSKCMNNWKWIMNAVTYLIWIDLIRKLLWRRNKETEKENNKEGLTKKNRVL